MAKSVLVAFIFPISSVPLIIVGTPRTVVDATSAISAATKNIGAKAKTVGKALETAGIVVETGGSATALIVAEMTTIGNRAASNGYGGDPFTAKRTPAGAASKPVGKAIFPTGKMIFPIGKISTSYKPLIHKGLNSLIADWENDFPDRGNDGDDWERGKDDWERHYADRERLEINRVRRKADCRDVKDGRPSRIDDRRRHFAGRLQRFCD